MRPVNPESGVPPFAAQKIVSPIWRNPHSSRHRQDFLADRFRDFLATGFVFFLIATFSSCVRLGTYALHWKRVANPSHHLFFGGETGISSICQPSFESRPTLVPSHISPQK